MKKNNRCIFDRCGMHSQKGAALMIVLWVMALLTVIAGEFVFSMRTEMNITINFKEEAEAYYAALAGVEEAKAEILSSGNEMKLDDNGILVFADKQSQRRGRFGNAVYSYNIIDEERNLNINIATPEQLKKILKYAGADDSQADVITDSIQDWRDPDDLHRINGAEEEYYRSLPKQYSCKDGPFDTVEELLLVKDVTPVIFGSNSEPDNRGIAKYLTAKSSGAVNVNTADRIVLEAAFGSAVAESIMSQRPFIAPAFGGIVKSSFFNVISTGVSGRTKRVVKVIIFRKNDKNIDTVFWNDNLI